VAKFIDMTGQRFGRLSVICYAGKDNSGLTLWECTCDCGTKIITRGQDLRRGASKSCGCLKLEQFIERSRKHGMAETRPYRIWKNMKSCCLNPNVKSYADYGGRGITICDAWANSFEAFWNDMGPSCAAGLEIDRIDHDGSYCPENCRWVDKKTQNRNTRANHFIETEFGRITIAVYAEKTSIPYDRLKYRVRKQAARGGIRYGVHT